MATRMESGTRTGWLFNYHATTERAQDEDDTTAGEEASRAALVLHFQDLAGDQFYVNYYYDPYILVLAVEGHEREVELGLMSLFGPQLIQQITGLEKEDLDLINHLSGKKRLYLKVTFRNVQDLTAVRGRLERMVKRNAIVSAENPLMDQFNGTLDDAMARTFAENDAYLAANSTKWMDWVQDMREYDVKYHMRVAIDCKMFCGVWYDITVRDGEAIVERCDDSRYAPAMPRVVAFDIETTKAPLRFPQPEVDQIYMISYMLDGRGYLITNREIVTEDIDPFEYTPKPEYEGVFETFNEPDEAATLRRFFDEMKKYRPNVYVTYNGDYFDFPFIHARALFHGMNMRNEIGFSQMADGAFLNPDIPHLDCFYWVKRDSYLPQGSQGLKAVTKYKLGYNPIEVDPEDMLPLAQENPQQMASYSVSDAVSTWYLYQKYVHPFIFSLATIIPMGPDDVLRKGSGGLCESLLMVQAEANNVVFPNKKEMVREKFHEGHLIDTETYIGGRVEALRSGVYRSDLPLQFNMNPDRYQSLIDDVDEALKFNLEVENGVKVEEVTNYDEIRDAVVAKLTALRDNPRQMECPIIYHLDVGAMYPNIILTNRLQPYAIASPDVCAGCCFNSPGNENMCKRSMSWKWRAELFTAGRYEFQRVKAQLENESFAAAVIEQTNLAAVQKKAYGQRKGNVLEGTSFERKNTWKPGDKSGSGGGGSGYRKESKRQQKEAADALLQKEFDVGGSDKDDSDDDGDGPKAFHKLNENTQFNMLKKRLGEYSRKAYGKIHESREVVRTNVVCQRENSFYVDTVRLFRDRRYEYKAALKKWKKNLENAKDADERKLCQSRCVQMESLQLAHKCILNSFYGYVMRKGSRWSSMEMAGIVTYLGATLIQMARALVQEIGVTLELDTDGIWCCLPSTFPENYTFTTSNPSKAKISTSYPCVVLNKMVHDRYSNHQYQNIVSPGVYKRHSENSIYFEVDGPYLAMLLPASREEGKSIKKRYAVFNPDGGLAELKGFELKRRGELMLVKDFQSQVFRRFLDGESLEEAYASAGAVANASLDLLESKGDGYEVEEVLEKITESSNMTRRLAEYPESQKSMAITTARRIAEFLGPQMVKDKGLACHYIVSRLPAGRPVTERAIPITIFKAEPAIRAHFLRKWTGDTSLTAAVDLKALLDWDYYTARFSACVQKIITIPAALQSLPNPVPRVQHPDWLEKRIRHQNSRFRQVSLTSMLGKIARQNVEEVGSEVKATGSASHGVGDVEDLFGSAPSSKLKTPHKVQRSGKKTDGGLVESDWEDEDAVDVASDDDMERMQQEEAAAQDALAHSVRETFFAPKSARPLGVDFFTHSGTKHWLEQRKEGWVQRARLRKEMALGNVPDLPAIAPDGTLVTGLGAHFIDVKSRALAETWNILEVREDPVDSAEDGTITVVAMLNKTLYSFRVLVPRRILVDVDTSVRGAREAVGGTATSGKVLPRHQQSASLFQVELPAGIDGDRQLGELRITEGVRRLYETHRTQCDTFIEEVGCCAKVDAARHLRNSRMRPNHQRDLFSTSEMEMTAFSSYLPSEFADRAMFIFHVVREQRGVIGVVNLQTASALAVFIQPAEAVRPAIAWKTLVEECARSFNTGSQAALEVVTEVAVDQQTAWRLVHQQLTAAMDSVKPPSIAVLESTQSTAALIQQRAVPAGLPYLRVMGVSEDEKLLADPFRWARLLAKRLLQRFYASSLWVAERLALSRISGIPICNIAQDSCVNVLDVLFSRALHHRNHVLWNPSDTAIAFDAVEERPRDVVMPGGYTSWCVEFSLSRLDVVALLFSQMIQESDDPNLQVLCDRGVSSHFNILRDLVAEILGQTMNNSLADTILGSVPRWIRDPLSSCYEPRLVEMLSNLTHRALTSILLRLAKLGGRAVRVSAESITVLSTKHSLQEAVGFARFVTTSLQDQPMMILLSLQPTRYWCPLLVLEKRDYSGLFLNAERALRFIDSEQPTLADFEVGESYTLLSRFPESVRLAFRERLQSLLFSLRDVAEATCRSLQDDDVVTLANRQQVLADRLVKRTQKFIEAELERDVLREVDSIAKSLELYSAEEHEAAAKHGGALTASSGAVALEYTKTLCRFLDLVPSDGAMGKLRNNCIRLCNLSPFSAQAQVTADPYAPFRTHSFLCGFCNNAIHVDLFATGPASLTCANCGLPVPPSSLEATLVRHVNQIVFQNTAQDFVCGKCKEMTVTSLAQMCCGPLVGKGKSLQLELQALKYIAQVHQFNGLDETLDVAFLAV